MATYATEERSGGVTCHDVMCKGRQGGKVWDEKEYEWDEEEMVG
jgi:hypothetical protein